MRTRIASCMLALGLVLVATVPAACQNRSTSPTMPNSFAGKTNAVPFPTGKPWLNTDQPLSLADLKGKIVLLDFWTYCCINCMHVLPDLKRLEHEYPELVVIGVHSAKFQNEQDAENIRQAILRYDIEHPVIVDNEFYLWQQYGIRAWPSFALIDPDGKYVGNTSGEGIYDRLKPYLDGLRAEFAAKGNLNNTRMTFALERNRQPASLLAYPGKIIADAKHNRLLFTDSNHNRIIVATPEGKIEAIIGSGQEGRADGSFETASFFRPQGLAYDAVRDVLYVADTENHLIREIDLQNRTVKTVLGTGQQARSYGNFANGTADAINSPWDLLLLNGELYIAMAGPHQLWRMNPTTYRAEVYAGSGRENIIDGPREQAALAQPSGLATDGRRIFFADSEVSAVRVVENDQVLTLIGEGLFEFGDIDGTYPSARLQHCIGVDYHGGAVLVADTYNHKIKKLDPSSKTLVSWLGSGKRGRQDGKASEATFSEPNDIVFLNGKYYITDTNNGLIRVYDPATDRVSTLTLQEPGRLSMLEVQRTASNPASVPFFGQTVTVEPQQVNPNGKVIVRLKLPEGYKLNTDAPNYAQIVGQAGSTAAIAEVDGFIQYTLPFAGANAPKLTLEAAAYYCEKGDAGRCLIKLLRFEVPATYAASAAEAVSVSYVLPVPEKVSR